jgi:hypothetical protein
MNRIRTSVAEMFIDSDGILHIKILEGVHVTIEKSKEYYNVSNQLLEGKKALVLVDGSAKFTITKEAKAYGAGIEIAENRIAVAFVTNSLVNKVMVNCYIKLYKPIVPTQLFSSEENALKWLKTFFVMPGDKYIKPKKRKIK